MLKYRSTVGGLLMILAGGLLLYGTLAKQDAANVVMAYLAVHTLAMIVGVVIIGLSAKNAADVDLIGQIFEGMVRASTSLSMYRIYSATHQFELARALNVLHVKASTFHSYYTTGKFDKVSCSLPRFYLVLQ